MTSVSGKNFRKIKDCVRNEDCDTRRRRVVPHCFLQCFLSELVFPGIFMPEQETKLAPTLKWCFHPGKKLPENPLIQNIHISHYLPSQPGRVHLINWPCFPLKSSPGSWAWSGISSRLLACCSCRSCASIFLCFPSQEHTPCPRQLFTSPWLGSNTIRFGKFSQNPGLHILGEACIPTAP